MIWVAVVVPCVVAVALGIVFSERDEARRQVSLTPPAGFSAGMRAEVWRLYRDEGLDVVSFLSRIDALYEARVGQLAASGSWGQTDWASDPLEPIGGHWRWEGDRLVLLASTPWQSCEESYDRAALERAVEPYIETDPQHAIVRAFADIRVAA